MQASVGSVSSSSLVRWGYLSVIISIPGIISIKRFNLEERAVLFWVFAVLLLSKTYYLGINVITYRLLIYIMIPVSILASNGLISVSKTLKGMDKNLARAFMVLIFIIAIIQGFNNLSGARVTDMVQ